MKFARVRQFVVVLSRIFCFRILEGVIQSPESSSSSEIENDSRWNSNVLGGPPVSSSSSSAQSLVVRGGMRNSVDAVMVLGALVTCDPSSTVALAVALELTWLASVADEEDFGICGVEERGVRLPEDEGGVWRTRKVLWLRLKMVLADSEGVIVAVVMSVMTLWVSSS